MQIDSLICQLQKLKSGNELIEDMAVLPEYTPSTVYSKHRLGVVIIAGAR